MRGHLERRSKTGWTIVIEMDRDPVTNERQRVYRAVNTTKREAEREMRKMQYQLETGTYIEPNGLTLGQYLDKWADIHSSNLAPKTIHSYRSEIKNHLSPNIGSIPLQKLTPLHLQDYYYKALTSGRKDGAGGLSSRTVLYHHRILSEALKEALNLQLIYKNPANQVKPPKINKKEMYALNKGETQAFLAATEGARDYPIFYTAIWTGLRQGELLGLRWKDVDLAAGVLCVRQQLQYIAKQGYTFKEPKSAKSKRQVPMTPELVALFKKIKREQAQHKLKFPGYAKHDLVFCLETGKPLDGTNLTKRFKTLATKNGHPKLRFHDLRHTFAALMIAANVGMEKLQALMGHENIETTIGTYGHLSPDTQRKAIDALRKFMSD